MRVLIGTPIHESKDYAMDKWLENVVRLEYPADLLLVDNSAGPAYAQKVKEYCAKYGVKNYRVEHFEVNNDHLDNAKSQKVEIAQEIIRRETLTGAYDAWFSWECDQIIPNNT